MHWRTAVTGLSSTSRLVRGTHAGGHDPHAAGKPEMVWINPPPAEHDPNQAKVEMAALRAAVASSFLRVTGGVVSGSEVSV